MLMVMCIHRTLYINRLMRKLHRIFVLTNFVSKMTLRHVVTVPLGKIVGLR